MARAGGEHQYSFFKACSGCLFCITNHSQNLEAYLSRSQIQRFGRAGDRSSSLRSASWGEWAWETPKDSLAELERWGWLSAECSEGHEGWGSSPSLWGAARIPTHHGSWVPRDPGITDKAFCDLASEGPEYHFCHILLSCWANAGSKGGQLDGDPSGSRLKAPATIFPKELLQCHCSEEMHEFPVAKSWSTTEMRSPTVLEVRSANKVSLGRNQGVSRAVQLLEILGQSLLLASSSFSGCWHFLPCEHFQISLCSSCSPSPCLCQISLCYPLMIQAIALRDHPNNPE